MLRLRKGRVSPRKRDKTPDAPAWGSSGVSERLRLRAREDANWDEGNGGLAEPPAVRPPGYFLSLLAWEVVSQPSGTGESLWHWVQALTGCSWALWQSEHSGTASCWVECGLRSAEVAGGEVGGAALDVGLVVGVHGGVADGVAEAGLPVPDEHADAGHDHDGRDDAGDDTRLLRGLLGSGSGLVGGLLRALGLLFFGH